ncbi:DUF5011 domain-containing protein [Rummeliibacillus sp. G93]|uniref:immunoglobulin-like domain-containing protein n=1 Tax=Rummeliibacillus sp. G93 TaxID=2939494 RepID=UPI00201C0709|nr:immunoglobulin-like domain-containing protein [Rummeliibacillus sp. G93]UQW97816.1 DUF5011 domain-containing protein [Rummeliibacillus sp. G93]
MKKYINGSLLTMVAFLFFWITAPNAKAATGVSLPSVNENISYNSIQGILGDIPNQTNALINNDTIMDLMTGNVLKEFDSYADTAVANEEGNVFALGDGYKLFIYDGFDKKVYQSENLFGAEDSYFSYYKSNNYDFTLDTFVPNEDVLLFSSKTKLIAFNTRIGQVEFVTGLSNSKQILATPSTILSISDKQINLYDNRGNYQDVIVPASNIETAVVSADYKKLYVATSDAHLQIYDIASGEQELPLDRNAYYVGNDPAIQMHIDQSGKYLAITSEYNGFKLFEAKTGFRIYTELDGARGPVFVMPKGKFVLVDRELYNGKNLNKYVTKINLSSKLLKLEIGYQYTPEVVATLANQSTQTINSQIKVQSSNLNVAYFDQYENKLIAAKKGTTTLRVQYLGFYEDKKVTVVDTKKPVIKGAKNRTIYQWSSFDPKAGVQAFDGTIDLTSKLKVKGKVNTQKPGTYKITYSVVDGAGHKTTKTIKVKVKKW